MDVRAIACNGCNGRILGFGGGVNTRLTSLHTSALSLEHIHLGRSTHVRLSRRHSLRPGGVSFHPCPRNRSFFHNDILPTPPLYYTIYTTVSPYTMSRTEEKPAQCVTLSGSPIITTELAFITTNNTNACFTMMSPERSCSSRPNLNTRATKDLDVSHTIQGPGDLMALFVFFILRFIFAILCFIIE